MAYPYDPMQASRARLPVLHGAVSQPPLPSLLSPSPSLPPLLSPRRYGISRTNRSHRSPRCRQGLKLVPVRLGWRLVVVLQTRLAGVEHTHRSRVVYWCRMLCIIRCVMHRAARVAPI